MSAFTVPGIVPMSKLLERLIPLNSLRTPIMLGSVPVRKFPASEMEVND